MEIEARESPPDLAPPRVRRGPIDRIARAFLGMGMSLATIVVERRLREGLGGAPPAPEGENPPPHA
jgi:hypothetical protein